MTSFNEFIQHSSSNAWLFIPSAILLGALHGLEPGHSKTMMAAFIVAVRGTIAQAVLLGLSAAISHSLVIWALAAVALHYGSQWNAEATEPYFQLVSGVIIIAVAMWMFVRTRRDQLRAEAHSTATRALGSHGGTVIDTGHGLVEVSVFETGVPPCFRLYFSNQSQPIPPLFGEQDVSLETVRPDGSHQTFLLVRKDDYLESTSSIPEPHEFTVKLRLAHGSHVHSYQTQFTEEEHHHGHGDSSQHHHSNTPEFQDAHEKAHASDIETRFAGKAVTTGQIVLFGLTGGLLPCPAALTVLLICLQLKKFVLGFSLVICFSVGLAITLVASGSLAAWTVGHASKRFAGFGNFARKAPYISSAVLTCMGFFIAYQGWKHLP